MQPFLCRYNIYVVSLYSYLLTTSTHFLSMVTLAIKNAKLNTTIISLWEYIHLLKTQFAVYSKAGMVYFLPLLLFFSSWCKTKQELRDGWVSFNLNDTHHHLNYLLLMKSCCSNELSYSRLWRETTKEYVCIK